MKFFRFLFSIYAMAVFIVLLFIIFPIALLSVFMRPIQAGNFVYRLCTIWADVWMALIFIRVKKIYEVPWNKNKKQLIVVNHISYLDIPLLVKIFRKPIRPLGKAEMGSIPLFGFIYKNAIVSVDRSSSSNRTRSIQLLKKTINRGISVLVFPEGTFNMTAHPLKEMYNGAFRIAIETQTPIQPVLFLDTYSRMHYSSLFSINPGKCRVVYLPEVSVAGKTIAAVEHLKQQVYNAMEEKLIAYNAPWIGAKKAEAAFI